MTADLDPTVGGIDGRVACLGCLTAFALDVLFVVGAFFLGRSRGWW